jgi:hypothetical protein
LIDRARAHTKRLRSGEAQMNRIFLFVAGIGAGVAATVAITGWTGWPERLRSDPTRTEKSHAADNAHNHVEGPPRIVLSEP